MGEVLIFIKLCGIFSSSECTYLEEAISHMIVLSYLRLLALNRNRVKCTAGTFFYFVGRRRNTNSDTPILVIKEVLTSNTGSITVIILDIVKEWWRNVTGRKRYGMSDWNGANNFVCGERIAPAQGSDHSRAIKLGNAVSLSRSCRGLIITPMQSIPHSLKELLSRSVLWSTIDCVGFLWSVGRSGLFFGFLQEF